MNKVNEALQRILLAFENGATNGTQDADWKTVYDEILSLYDHGHDDQDDEVLGKALEVAQRTKRPIPRGLAEELDSQAFGLGIMGQYEQAIRVFKAALLILESSLGQDHPDVGESRDWLASFYVLEGEFAQAEPLYKRSLAVNEKALGPDHICVATTLENLAALYRKTNRAKEAEPLEVRAAAIRAINR